MEEPIQFSVWGEPVEGSRREIVDLLAAMRPDEPRAAILRMVSRALRNGVSLCFAGPLGWAATQKAKQDAISTFRNIQTFQAGYGPDDLNQLDFCETHDVFYGGCLGCPVCNRMNDP